MLTSKKSKKDVILELCVDLKRQIEKENCRRKSRRDKSVKLSKYIEKEDGTLVPKPKVIPKLKGVQPRPGGFIVKKQRVFQSICSAPVCRELSELKSLSEKTKGRSFVGLQHHTTATSCCNLSDLELNPIDEENIVDHFERLLKFLNDLAKCPGDIKEREACCVIQFLESVSTPNRQLAPNAQALVNYIDHLLEEKCGIPHDEKNVQDDDTTTSTDDGDNDECQRVVRIKDSKVCIQPKPKRSCSNRKAKEGKSKGREQLDETEIKRPLSAKLGRTQIVKDFCPRSISQIACTIDNAPDQTSNENKIQSVIKTNKVCKQTSTTRCKETSERNDNIPRIVDVTSGTFEVTSKEVVVINRNRVQKVENLTVQETVAMNNMNCIGDNLLCGDEIVQKCHEPASRSRSNSSYTDETSMYSSVSIFART
ncbi:hypothetical protein M8J77_005402 [Diaphorina citri]|nr:hypothetical protein M8J77_005402 [Diaphorina citri]